MKDAGSSDEVAGNSLPSNRYSPNPLQRAKALRDVLASRLFFLVTGLTTLAYLSFFAYIDFVTGSPVMAGFCYFVLYYSLIALSSILMGLNVYSLRSRVSNAKVKTSATVGSSSASVSLFGGMVGCSCHTSLLLPLLSSLGLGTIAGIGVISALVEYQLWILAAFIILQLYLAYHVLGRIRHLGLQAVGTSNDQVGRAIGHP